MPVASRDIKVVFFKSAGDFHRWLDAKHQRERELWAGFYKKSSGKPSITYGEALDEALCFGWIDGLRKSVDADAYTIRFTPRKPASEWSAINIKRAQQLIDSGRMCPAGLKAFAGAHDQPRKYSCEQRKKAHFDKKSERLLSENRKAWDFFQNQPPGYRRTATFWVMSAKKEETRHARLSALIADSERGQPIKPLRRSPVSNRQEDRQ